MFGTCHDIHWIPNFLSSITKFSEDNNYTYIYIYIERERERERHIQYLTGYYKNKIRKFSKYNVLYEWLNKLNLDGPVEDVAKYILGFGLLLVHEQSQIVLLQWQAILL